MSETANTIVGHAIRMIRQGGYNSFSFRKIAEEMGIKSASIHYHFPNKEALGVAVTERYDEEFFAGLGAAEDHEAPIAHYVESFEGALASQGAACMCGILAAEAGQLPETVREALGRFTERNLRWVEAALRREQPGWSEERVVDTASVIFSALEGAITFAAMARKPEHLAQVGGQLRRLVAG
ncbi:MAG: TetR/AcrR family transcriptional regulator [Verrucomicrobiota bacterium]